MSRVAALLLFLSTAFCLPSAALATPPDSVQLTYDVYKGSLRIGTIEESYSRDKNRYSLSSVTRAVGLLAVFKPGRIVISSNGLIGQKGLQPLHFSDRREGEERRNRDAEFDWEARQVTMIHQSQRNVAALPEGTQDRLSAMYQFMFLALKPETTLAFAMTSGGKLDDYRFAISSGEKLKTPAGEFDTLYLVNQPAKGGSKTEIWLAVDRHNLPCKMTITDADGGQLTQVLSKLTTAP